DASMMKDAEISEEAYKIFTKKYDEIIDASRLTSREEREVLCHELESKSMLFKEQINPLAQKLYRFLKTQSPIQWKFDEEEGYLNGARLSQKIIDPTFRYIYKSMAPNDSLGTAVTVLVDNSGSMRGRPITLAALSASFLAQTLERCGVKLEVLGFTTIAWQGGKSFQEWTQKGKSPCPGRLNDTRHIIYKSFETPWARARLSLGVMLKEGILKENIDGEALLWAAGRLFKTEERRKILIMISDGASIDDMTLAHNPPGYLEKHLKSVLKTLNHASHLHLFAIGIGHDVTRLYSKAITLKSADFLGKTLFEELPKLFKEEEKI
ncbi:MAG TPA: cobaltochelatase subunit CobT, partial [Alphaproteobacteria bacterium]|nr:cobaltochelatase subunit CobT [Alphaproteobacteria bacterium]